MIKTRKQRDDEFDEMEKNHGWIPEHKERVKDFISLSHTELLDGLVKAVEGMKLKIKIPRTTKTGRKSSVAWRYEKYNQALSDVLALLESTKKDV